MATDIALIQAFAHEAHDSIGQKRKYSGEPYWVHTDEVAGILTEHGAAPHIVAASHVHDYLEDVNPNGLALLRRLFGDRIALLAVEVTDVFTHEAYPHLNRAVRKGLEAQRLGLATIGAQIIKLADLISNTSSIVEHDPGFAVTYLQEKSTILSCIGFAIDNVHHKVHDYPHFDVITSLHQRAQQQVEDRNVTVKRAEAK